MSAFRRSVLALADRLDGWLVLALAAMAQVVVSLAAYGLVHLRGGRRA
jgi:hypothetical protein